MCWLSCFILFWNTKYNTPRTFCLADYSVVFHDQRRVSAFAYLRQPFKLHTGPWVQPLGPLRYPFSYQLTGLVLLWSQHHLLLSIDSGYPCGPVSQRSFHNSQRHCYNHPSYRWSLPRGSEQACIDEPLLAQSCRRILLWAPRGAYSNEAMPPNSYTTAHTVASKLPTFALYRAKLCPLT